MDNTINFMGKSNNYLAITKKGWNHKIPNTAYNQINKNRKELEKYAKNNGIKITITDGYNMRSELETGREIDFWQSKMVVEVEKKPSLLTKIKTKLSKLGNKIFNNTPKLEITSVPYYTKQSKSIPNLKENQKIGFLVDYESNNGKMNERVDITTIADFLQTVVGKKSDKLSMLK